MPKIELITQIRAGRERCFDLARDLDLHVESMAHTSEKAVAGRTTGLIGLGERVTWRGRHFGVVHEHESLITSFDRPRHFRDEMVRGRFRRFVHDHVFQATLTGTRMIDIVEFASPLRPLGWLVDVLVLERYLERLLRRRNDVIKREAEVGPNP